ncbi:hypothetical protein [Rosistilla oblonga]|uniref:hypothetical protein n=1 Tax=Rosistilla oblonga TaxID=2527990 RepID=UPI003A973AFD
MCPQHQEPPLNHTVCPKCHREVDDRAVGCPHCGERIYVEVPGGITPTRHPPMEFPENAATMTPKQAPPTDVEPEASQQNDAEYCVIAEFDNRDDFATALRVLEKAGYTRDEVSTITRVTDPSFAQLSGSGKETGVQPPGSKTTGVGALIGGALGGLLGTATMVGPMLLAGPIVGMAAGAVGGSVWSAMENHGVQEEDASGYAARVRDGALLIVVTGPEVRVREASNSLQTVGPRSLERYDNPAAQ